MIDAEDFVEDASGELGAWLGSSSTELVLRNSIEDGTVEFVVFLVEGSTEAFCWVDDDVTVTDKSEGWIKVDGREALVGTADAFVPVGLTLSPLTPGKRLENELEDFAVNDSTSSDAAPDPLPKAGAEPTCLVVAITDAPPSAEDEDVVESVGFSVFDDGRSINRGCVGAMVAVLDIIDAAPGPLPIARTEPTCPEGAMRDTEATCARGTEVASIGSFDSVDNRPSVVDS